MNPSSRFFLGTAAPGGFFSLYDELSRPGDELFLYCIKGTPGSGKSTFMRTIAGEAEALGLKTEVILCSGDTDSIDGIILPERRLAYVDATAPHAQEPAIPGVTGDYLRLGGLCRPISSDDRSALRAKKAAAERCYRRAYGLLAALREAFFAAREEDSWELGYRTAAALIPAGDGFVERRRLFRAVTAEGTPLSPQWFGDCARISLPGQSAMEGARTVCRERRQRIISCPAPLCPEKTEALFVPACGFVFQNERFFPSDDPAFSPPADYSAEAAAFPALFGAVTAELAEAKHLHAEIEAIYRPYADFEENNRLLLQHLHKLRADA